MSLDGAARTHKEASKERMGSFHDINKEGAPTNYSYLVPGDGVSPSLIKSLMALVSGC